MSNHSSIPNDEIRDACEKLFSANQPTGEEFAKMIDASSNELGFGATGEFPEGKITDDDEGEIQFGVTTKDEKVVLNFGKPVAWFGMTRDQAEKLGRLLINRAKGIA